MPADDETSMDIGALMGAQPFRGQRLSLYIPSRTKTGKPINQRLWVEDALDILARIGGGATATPHHEGIWIGENSIEVMRDNPVIVYCFIEHDKLIEKVDDLRKFLHAMGRENSQDAVAFDFDGFFFLIDHKDYDEATV